MPGIASMPVSAACLATEARTSASSTLPTDGIRHVQREEIMGIEEGIHVVETDVIGVDVVGRAPSERRRGGVRLAAHVGRVRADQGVLPVRLVPDRRDLHASLPRQEEGAELRLALTPEAIPEPHRVFPDSSHVRPSQRSLWHAP